MRCVASAVAMTACGHLARKLPRVVRASPRMFGYPSEYRRNLRFVGWIESQTRLQVGCCSVLRRDNVIVNFGQRCSRQTGHLLDCGQDADDGSVGSHGFGARRWLSPNRHKQWVDGGFESDKEWGKGRAAGDEDSSRNVGS